MKKRSFILTIIFLLFTHMAFAQSELAATLEVLEGTVEVQREGTVNPILVDVYSVIGVGDIIRTGEDGQARITFFADGTDVLIEPATEYQIVRFEEEGDDFHISVELIIGQATHRLNRTLGTESSYDVKTPGMTLAARGTVFAVLVEEGGQSGMLVREGVVDANSDDDQADVPEAYGIRSNVNQPLSDVVLASTFDQLNAALDGCTALITTPDDVRLNVRIGPTIDYPRIGTVAAIDVDTVIGVSASGNWYRIPFKGGYGWILASDVEINESCAGLRGFADNHVEDVSQYQDLTEVIDPENLAVPTITPEATQDATDQ